MDCRKEGYDATGEMLWLLLTFSSPFSRFTLFCIYTAICLPSYLRPFSPPVHSTAGMADISRHEHTAYDKTLSYLEAGPQDGPLLIFIHGWPAIAETWKPQLVTFAGLGFRVVAPDMPGYGQSTKTKEKRDYSLKNIVASLIGLLKHLGSSDAVWIGHDWGAGVVWALLAHHPEACRGVVNMCIPYRTLERGVYELIKYANRDIYPENEYPHAQWSYQIFYEVEEDYEKCIKFYEADLDNFVKAVYGQGNPDHRDKPAFTANVVKDGGWFGGAVKPPQVPLSSTLLNEELHRKLVEAFKEGGFWAPTAYYLNHDVNLEWCEEWSINEGVVSLPVLFIEASNDDVAGTYNSSICEPMRSYCRRLTEVSIEAGHWVALEKPLETNAAIAKWMATVLPTGAWPYDKRNPFKSNA